MDNPGADGTKNCVTDQVSVDPGTSQTLKVRIFPVPWKLDKPLELVGMRGYPVHEGKVDSANVTQLVVFVTQPKENYRLRSAMCVREARCRSSMRRRSCRSSTSSGSTFTRTGRARRIPRRSWSHTAGRRRQTCRPTRAREAGISTAAGPADRSSRAQDSSGSRNTAANGGLSTPIGRLFWSHGIDCVRGGNSTPITGREPYFRSLPAQDSSFATFYATANWAPVGYYKDHAPYKTYDIGRANLLRKYGEDFDQAFANVTQQRLGSWGVNTIANWSDEQIGLMRQTPYVGTISFEARKLEGSEGYWGKFYDVFDPGFERKLHERLEGERDARPMTRGASAISCTTSCPGAMMSPWRSPR